MLGKVSNGASLSKAWSILGIIAFPAYMRHLDVGPSQSNNGKRVLLSHWASLGNNRTRLPTSVNPAEIKSWAQSDY